MTITADSLPDDVAILKAMVIAAEVKAQNAEAEAKARALLIEQMKFTIAKLRHEQYGQSSERSAVLEQLELQLADLEEDASEAEARARMAAAAAAADAKVKVEGFQRKRVHRIPGSHRRSETQAPQRADPMERRRLRPGPLRHRRDQSRSRTARAAQDRTPQSRRTPQDRQAGSPPINATGKGSTKLSGAAPG